jgi:hypothetical protein
MAPYAPSVCQPKDSNCRFVNELATKGKAKQASYDLSNSLVEVFYREPVREVVPGLRSTRTKCEE